MPRRPASVVRHYKELEKIERRISRAWLKSVGKLQKKVKVGKLATAIEIASSAEIASMKGGSPTALERPMVGSRFSEKSVSLTLKTFGRSEASGIL